MQKIEEISPDESILLIVDSAPESVAENAYDEKEMTFHKQVLAFSKPMQQ